MEKLGKKILIVEDDLNLHEILTKELALAGFDTVSAKDGEEGLSVALDERPDLILLDIVMPKKDGVAMLQELRKDAWGKGAAVIILSNLDSTEYIEQTLGKGALDFIVKSRFDTASIVKKIKERLKCQ